MIIKTFQVAECHETAEVYVSFLVHDKEDEMIGHRASVARRGAVLAASRCDIDLTSQNGFDVPLCGLPEKLYCSEHVSMVRHGYGLHAEAGRSFQESIDSNCAIQETVFRVNMQVGEIFHKILRSTSRLRRAGVDAFLPLL
jgi:hypothetical protein